MFKPFLYWNIHSNVSANVKSATLYCEERLLEDSGNRTLINLFGLGRTVKHYFGRSLVCLSCTSYTSRFHQVASKSNAQSGQI